MMSVAAGGALARYTVWGDSTVDRHVDELLRRAVVAVTQQMGADLEAVVLCGGFGRGEGSVLRLSDGLLHVVNDFDLELAYREPLGRGLSKLLIQLRHRRALAALAERLARQLGMKQVDLTLRGLSSYQRLDPSLANHDGLYGHRLLFGNVDPFARSSPLPASAIDRFEGTWLLRNRGVGLVLARLYLDESGGLQAGNRENFYIEINKSVLAVGDALALLAGGYHVSYERRKREFQRWRELGFPWFNELAALYDEAAENKLRPTAEPYPGRDPEALWTGVTRLHVRAFLWHESSRLQRDVSQIAGWQMLVSDKPRAGFAVRVMRALRQRMERRLGATGSCPQSMAGLRQDKLASVACTMALLASRSGVEAEDARRLLEQWPVGADLAGASEDGAKQAARIWSLQARGLLAALHPGGEVGRFLAHS